MLKDNSCLVAFIIILTFNSCFSNNTSFDIRCAFKHTPCNTDLLRPCCNPMDQCQQTWPDNLFRCVRDIISGMINNNMEKECQNIIIDDDSSETEDLRPRIYNTMDDEIIIISNDETDINNSIEQISGVTEDPNPDISISMDEFPVLIRENLNAMVFDDLKVTTDLKICGSCLLYQPRTMFRPSRHRFLCLRCKKGYELLIAQENNELKCLICNCPSTSIMILY